MSGVYMKDNNSMKRYVEHKVQQIKNDYLNNYERVIADYEREVENRQSYHGRELLELLQNADDEMKGELNPKAKIVFDGKNLIVSNNGRAFQEKGVSSLMLSNLSPKRKNRQLIGNKGTGFRSILSWAESIRIDSGDLHIRFSADHSQKMLSELYNGVFPEEMTAATLAFPQWIDEKTDYDYTTTIAIKTKNNRSVQNDIEEQIGKLNSEILIFLNNIRELEIISPQKTIRYVRTFKDNDVVLETIDGDNIIDHQEWRLFKSIDNHFENELFSIVIAYNKDGKAPQNNVLHAYFPTKVDFPFPVLLHADFNVDSHRNQLEEGAANTFILRKAAELLVKTAIELHDGEDASYGPLKFLIPQDTYNRDLRDHEFGISLITAIKNALIFPTVNNKYVRYSKELKFYTGSLAEYVYGNSFNDLLQYSDSPELDRFLKPIFCNNPGYDFYEFVSAINEWASILPRTDDSLRLIVRFLDDMIIDEDLSDYFLYNYEEDTEKNFKIFFDSNFEIINYIEPRFIAGKEDIIKDIPSFIHFNSLHPVMEEAIFETENISQHLEDLRIFEYKFEDIIETANIAIDATEDIKLQILYSNELLQWTYVYSDSIKQDMSIYVNAPTRNGEILSTNVLFMGKEYGNNTGENLLVDLLPRYFIADISELIGTSKEETAAFLVKLGVSKYPRIKTTSLYYSAYGGQDHVELKQYTKLIIQSLKYPLTAEGDKFNTADEFFRKIKDIRVSVNSITGIKAILSKAKTKDIIAWIKEDDKFREILFSPHELSTNNISLRWNNQNKDRSLDCSVLSYLRFVFLYFPWIDVNNERYRIDDCLLSNEKEINLSPYLVFPNVGEYVSELSGKIVKNKDEYTSVLKNLGMKSNFSDLSVKKIYEVLMALPNIPDSGAIAKTFYESILEENSRKRILEEIDISCPKTYTEFISKGQVYCRNGKYVENKNASYISKRDICESILETVNILNLSGRSVSYKNIPQILGVKELRIQGMELVSYEEHPNNVDFLKDFNQYKALAFTYRVNAKQDPKSQARLFSRLEIVLCSKIQIAYKNQLFELIDGEFYHDNGDRYYLCCSTYNKNMKRVKIGSGIASIICAHLNVFENRSDFRELYIAGTQTDRKAILRDSFDDDTIQKARKMMNSDEDIRDTFIQTLVRLSNKELSSFERIIESIDFEDISSVYNASKIIKLFTKLEIDIEEFNRIADFALDLEPFYRKEVERLIPRFINLYKNSWYEKLKNSSIEQKSQLQAEFLKYDDLCRDIKVRNSVYFEPEKEIADQLSINVQCPQSNLAEIYNNNLKVFIEKLGDDSFVDDFLSKPLNASLLYYAEYDELMKNYESYVEEIRTTTQKDQEQYQYQDKTRRIQYVEITSTAPNLVPISKTTSNKKSHSSTGYKDNRKSSERLGKDGELLIYNDLVRDPKKKFVRWVSENGKKAGVNPEGSATAGYDMEYTDEDGKRYYIEVKSTNGKIEAGISFHLSANEHQFAINNSESYLIYYVTEVDTNPKVSVLRDVFKDNEFNFEKYSYSIGEYIVTADVRLTES